MNTITDRSSIIFPLILFLLLLTNTLSLFNREVNLATFGKLSLNATLYFSIVLFFVLAYRRYFGTKRVHSRLTPLYVALTLLIGIYIISHIWNQNTEFDTVLLQFIVSYIFFLSVVLIDWRDVHFQIMAVVANVLICLIFAAWIYFDLPMRLFSSEYVNANLTSLVVYCLLFLQVLGLHYTRNLKVMKYIQFGLIFVTLFITYLTSSRATFLAIFIVLVAWGVYKFMRQLFSLLFFVVMGFNAVFVFIYTRSEDMFLISALNKVSNALFNKDIFTGREAIWRNAIEHGMTSPLIGHRVNIRPVDYTPNTKIYHVHNYYIETFLESGILGLIAFIIVLYVIWSIYVRNLDNYIVRISAFFYLGILFYWNMDLSSFFINQAVGLLLWFVIGVGVSAGVYSQLEKRNLGRRGRRRRSLS